MLQQVRSWSRHELSDLHQLILEGFTSYEIAERLDRTRNAICNAAQRNGWNIGVAKPHKTVLSVAQLPTLPVVEPRLGPKVRRRRKLPTGVAATVAIGRNECRWPVGDPCKPDFTYCGKFVEDEDEVYCRNCRAKAFAPPR